MKIKRILALFICFVVAISVLPSAGFAKDDTFSVDKEKVDVLTQLGIVEYPMDEAMFDMTVTRADFAVYVANIIGITEKNECDKRYYTDLPEDHWAYHTINTMTEKGYLQGTDGKFNPEDSITYQQAIAMILNSLGYNDLIALRGGWPSGYTAIAQELDIVDRNADQKEAITFAVACELLHDTLLAPLLEYTKLNQNEASIEISRDQTVMGKFFDVYRVTGIVNSVNGIKIDTKSAGSKGVVRIDDTEYDCEIPNAMDFLGKWVYAYYKEDGLDNKIFYLISRDDENCLTIDVKDFYQYDSSAFTVSYVENDSSRVKNQKIAANAVVIRNGEDYSSNVSRAFDGLNCGSIQLSSSQRKGEYDIVIIKNYEDVIVSSFDKAYEKIYDKRGDAYFLDLSLVENYRIMDSDGNPIRITDIEKDDVLSVCKSSEYCEIYVNSVAYSGNVEKIDNDDNDKYMIVTVEDANVFIDVSYYRANAVLFRPGTQVKVFVNVFGLGVYAEAIAGDDFLIGWVIRAKGDDTGESICYMTLLTQNNKIEKFMCADVVKIGGKRLSNGADIESELGGSPVKGQLIRYKLDQEGRINRIEIASEKVPSSATGLYQASATVSSAHYYSTNMMMGPTIKLTPSTMCFSIPDDTTDLKGYAVLTPNQLVSDSTYNYVTPYKTTNQTHTAEILVVRENTAGSWGREMYLVEKVYDTLDEDDEIVKAIDVYVNGAKRTIYEGRNYSFAENGIESGDVWIFWMNAQGEITSGSREIYNSSTGVANDFGHAFNWEPYIGFGYITSIKDGVAKYGCSMSGTGVPLYDTNEGNWAKSALLPIVGASIVTFDSGRKKKVDFGDESDLYEAMKEGSIIFVAQTFGSVQGVIIIK